MGFLQVNTPSRIKAYLQDQFRGILLIMPLEEIPLVSAISGLDSAPNLPLASTRPSPTEREAVAAEILSVSPQLMYFGFIGAFCERIHIV